MTHCSVNYIVAVLDLIRSVQSTGLKNVQRTCRGPSNQHVTPRIAFRAEWNAVHAGYSGQPAGMWYCLIIL